MEFHWFEAKQLDRVTNFSTETEILKAGRKRGFNTQYYCTFAKRKEYYGLENNINYLGFFKNKFIKVVEFHSLVIINAILLVLNPREKIIMVNQDLIKSILPAIYINKLFKRKAKFVVDVRTTPTNPTTFEKDMKNFHKKFKVGVRHFDGLSFITPYMERYVMSNYKTVLPTVNWSSGADTTLFDYNIYNKRNENKPFTIFYHGGISISRGNLNLIKACEDLINKGYKLELVQVGICVDKEIENYIINKKIEDWCKLLPPVPLQNIPQLIADCDLPVLPFPDFMAWRVSSPIKLMEYLAMGKKSLAPNIEAFTDVFKNTPDLIFLYESTSNNIIKELSKSIAHIIDASLLEKHNPQNAVDFVCSNYTWDKQANNLFEFCKSL